MENLEERLHKLVMYININDTKDVIHHKANEIVKSKVLENFNGLSISFGGGGIRSGSGCRMISDVDPTNTKTKGDPTVDTFDENHLVFVAVGSDPFDVITKAAMSLTFPCLKYSI